MDGESTPTVSVGPTILELGIKPVNPDKVLVRTLLL